MEAVGLEGVFDLKQWDAGIRKYQAGTQQVNAATDRVAGSFNQKWSAVGATVTRATALMGGALVTAAGAAGAAIAGFAVSGISKAMDLESQLSSIAATLTLTKEQVAPLNDLILQLGLDPNLKVSATEAATAIENLAKNGLSMTQIIDGAARSTVLLANATGADFGMAADIASDTMSLFNIKAEDMARAVDQITGVTNASKFTINDYRLAIAQAGGVAAAVGVSFEDFNTTIAAISPLFASGSDAGTAYKTFLQRLIPTTTAAEEVFAELELVTFDTQKAMDLLARNGIKPVSDSYSDVHRALQGYFEDTFKVSMATQEGIDKWGKWTMEIGLMQNAFFGQNGQMKDMDEITSILHESTKGLSEEQKNLMFSTMFGTDAMRAGFGIAASGAVMYKTAAEAAKVLGVSIEDASAVAEGGITKFEAMQLQIGKIDASEQAATRMDNFKGSLEILQGAIETVQIQIGQAFLPMLKELAEMGTTLINAYGPVVLAAFQSFSDALGEFFTAIQEGQSPLDAFRSAMAEFGLQGTTIANSMIAIGGAVSSVTQQFLAAIKPVTDFIGQHVKLSDVLIALGAMIASVVLPALWSMAAAMAPVLLTIGGAILVVAALRSAWEADFLSIKTKTTEAITAITTAFEPFTTAIQTHGMGALTEIKNFSSGTSTEFVNLAIIFGAFKLGVESLFTAIVNSITTNLPTWKAQLAEWGNAAWKWVTEVAIPFATTEIGKWVTAVTNFISDNLPQWVAKLQTWADAAWKWITETAIPFVITEMGKFVTTITNFISDNLPQWVAKLGEWASAAWKWIAETAIPFAVTEIGKWVTALTNFVKDNLPQWVAKLKDWGDAAWKWITEVAIPFAVTKIGEFVTALTNYIKDNLPQWQAKLKAWGDAAWQWIVTATTAATTEIGKFTTAVTTGLESKYETFKSTVTKYEGSFKGLTTIIEGNEKAVVRLGGSFEEFGKDVKELDFSGLSTQFERLGGTVATLGLVFGAVAAFFAGPILISRLNLFSAAIEGAGEAFQIVIDGMEEALRGINDAWKGTFDFINGLITGDFPKAWQGLKDSFGGAMLFITAIAGTAWGLITFGFTAMKDAIINTLSDLGITQAAQEMWGNIQKAWDIAKGTLIELWGTITQGISDKILNPARSWLLQGQDVIAKVRDGIDGAIGLITTAIAGVVTEITNGLGKAIDQVVGIGENIIGAIGTGFDNAKGALIERIKAFADLLPQWLKDALGIASPSTVTMAIGKDAALGFIVGFESMQTRLLNRVGQMTGRFTQALVRNGQEAISAYSSIVSKFSSIDFAGLGEMPGSQSTTAAIQKERAKLNFLKQQASLIEAIRESGGDPSQVLSGIALGANASPLALAQVAARAMESLNRQLEESLKASVKTPQKVIDDMRASRESIEQIEGEFTQTHLSQLERYKQDILALDKNIAHAEQQLLLRGDQASLATINQLDRARVKAITSLHDYLDESAQLQGLVAQMRGNRQSVQAVEDEFKNLSQLERYKQEVSMLDTQIAQAEQQLLETHDQQFRTILDGLDARRQQSLESIHTYLQQSKQMETSLALLPTFANDRAQEAADDFRTKFIDPLLAGFDQLTVAQRGNTLKEIDRLRGMLTDFAGSIQQVVAVEQQATKALEGFGETATARVEAMMAAIYNPTLPGTARTSAIGRLQEFINSLGLIKAEMSKQRITPDELIAQMTANPTQLDRYKQAIERIDQQIAAAHTQMMETGNASLLSSLKNLDTQRAQSIETLKQFLTQAKQVQATLARMPTFRTQRAQAGADAFRARFIDPLVAAFDQQTVAQREVTLKQIDRYLGMLQEYSTRMQNAAAVEKHARLAMEGFGEGAQQRVENLLNTIYDVGTPTASRDNAIQSLRDFATSLNAIRSELTTRSGQRDSAESMIQAAMGSFDQLSAYKEAIASVDDQIANITATIEATGNVAFLPQLRNLDARRQLSANELKNYLLQMSQLQDAFRNIKNLTGPGQTSAQRFVDEQIQPILDAFDKPMRPQERAAWIQAAIQRVRLVNEFVGQMRVVEKLLARVEGKAGFDHLADEFAALTDIATPEPQRTAMIATLTSYITQMERLFALQQDLSVGLSAGPMVERFKSDRLDAIAKQLENINLSEAQRNQLIEQYRIEQEKILAIQRKQQQLTYLEQQLDLIDKLRSLDDEEDFALNVDGILQGITFGMNAGLDDMLALTGRVIDEMIRFANQRLQIHSPSKVFAKIGQYMMQGWGKGISDYAMEPVFALNQASNMVPYALSSRSLTVNMGGIQIRNGMDERVFENRVRQIIRSEFAG